MLVDVPMVNTSPNRKKPAMDPRIPKITPAHIVSNRCLLIAIFVDIPLLNMSQCVISGKVKLNRDNRNIVVL